METKNSSIIKSLSDRSLMIEFRKTRNKEAKKELIKRGFPVKDLNKIKSQTSIG